MSLLMQALKMAEQSRQAGPASEALNEEVNEEALPAPSAAKREIPADAAQSLASNASPAPAMQLNPPPAASTVPLTDFPSLSLSEPNFTEPNITEPDLSLLAKEELLLEELLAKGEAASWEELPPVIVENEPSRSDAPSATPIATPLSLPASPQLPQLPQLDSAAGRLGLGKFGKAAQGPDSKLDDLQLELAEDYAAKDRQAESIPSLDLEPLSSESFANQPAIPAKSATRGELGNSHAPDERNEFGELKPTPAKPASLHDKPAAAATPTRANAQDQAKSVFGAKKGPKSKQPLLIFALSATCAVLIGGYFYLQNQNNSNTFVNLPPRNLANQAPIINGAQNPGANPVANPVGNPVTNTATNTAAIPTPSGAGAPSATPAANTPTAQPVVNSATATAKPPVLASASPAAANSTAVNGLGQAELPIETATAKSAAALPVRATAKPRAVVQDDAIQLARTTSRVQISPGLEGAYRAYQQGDLATAQQAYRTLLQQEPNNRDAILGLAASAMRLNNAPEAANLYLRLLELDPHDPDATAALIGMQQSDPQQAESRLKKILNQHPQSASLHFMLGNVYAQQERWSDAQQSYFRAFSNAPNNADYLFNLAVSLDRLGQSKLALDYYQRALQLAQSTGSGFSGGAVQERIRDLQAQLSNSGK